MVQGDLKGAVEAGDKINVAVLGASGYTGAEVIRLGANHPNLNFTKLTAERAAGKEFGDVFPSLAPAAAGTLVKIADVNFDDIDAVFCCLPHATTQEVRSRPFLYLSRLHYMYCSCASFKFTLFQMKTFFAPSTQLCTGLQRPVL